MDKHKSIAKDFVKKLNNLILYSSFKSKTMDNIKILTTANTNEGI
jgi:hypothetical protein